jgi:osmoprotectant transport system permease protein
VDTFRLAVEYALDPRSGFVPALGRHLQLSLVALAIAALIGVTLGIAASRWRPAALVLDNAAGIVRVIPALALLFMLIPVLGTGFAPSVVALTVLAIPPLLINTEAGMSAVAPAILEAGRGMGMTYPLLLWRVQLPLALPVMLAGVRIAALEVLASATLATFIGGGGLGDFISSGLSQSKTYILLVGAVPVALMALATEVGLSYLQRRLLRHREQAAVTAPAM